MRQVACSFKQSIQFYLHSNFTVTNSQRYIENSNKRIDYHQRCWRDAETVIGETMHLLQDPYGRKNKHPLVDFICFDACNHLKSAGMNSTLTICIVRVKLPIQINTCIYCL